MSRAGLPSSLCYFILSNRKCLKTSLLQHLRSPVFSSSAYFPWFYIPLVISLGVWESAAEFKGSSCHFQPEAIESTASDDSQGKMQIKQLFPGCFTCSGAGAQLGTDLAGKSRLWKVPSPCKRILRPRKARCATAPLTGKCTSELPRTDLTLHLCLLSRCRTYTP